MTALCLVAGIGSATGALARPGRANSTPWPPACARSNDDGQITALCTRALDAAKGGQRADILVARGFAHWRRGAAAAAAQDATEAIGLDQARWRAWHLRGLLDAQRLAYDAALAAYSRSIALDPKQVYTRLGRAQVRMRVKDLDGALADLDAAVALAPNEALALGQRAQLRRARGENAAAADDFEQAIRKDPNNMQLYAARAEFDLDQAYFDAAIVDASAAIRLAPRTPEIYVMRARAYQARRASTMALGDYTVALSLDPDNAEAYRRRGELLAARGENAAAIADFANLLRLKPGDPQALVARGRSYRRDGDPQRALIDLDEAVAKAPGSPDVQFERAESLAALGRKAEAFASVNAALDLEPDRPLALLLRADLRRSDDPVSAALDDRAALAAGGPALKLELLERSKQLETSQPQEAMRFVETGLRLSPGSVALLEIRSRLRAARKDYAAAMDDLTLAMAQEGADVAHLTLRRAQLAQASGDLAKAIADFTAVIARDDAKAADAWAGRADIYGHQENWEAAARDFGECLRRDAWRHACANAQAWALHKLGDDKGAAVLIERALNVAPDNGYYLDTQGHVLERLGRRDEAIAAFRRALTRIPDLPESKAALERLGAKP